jgi:magnesium-transporting ATPase (P-type)
MPVSIIGKSVYVQADAPELHKLTSDHLGLIIEGPALVHVFGDGEMERLLLRVAVLCKSVVACRVSPAQKRMIVRYDPQPFAATCRHA